MFNKKNVWVAIPAQNCAHSIEEVIERVNSLNLGLSIIVVDDCSQDDTAERANKFDNVVVHKNKVILGYGGTTTKLYEIAFSNGADYVINLHGDLGHKPEDILSIFEVLTSEKVDFVFGSRLVYLKNQFSEHGAKVFFNKELVGGMSFTRLVGHFGLTFIQNVLFNQSLNSYHEGMRGCGKGALAWILQQQLPDWYDYDATLLITAASNHMVIEEVPTPPHYDDLANSSAPPFRYGIKVLISSFKRCLYFRKISRKVNK